MRITKSEFNSLKNYIKSHDSKFPIGLKYAIGGLDPRRLNQGLEKMGADKLALLIASLPSGKGTSITSPILTRIKKKARTSLAGLRVPHLDPEASVMVYRMKMRLNNSRAGIRAGAGGQFYKLNPKGASIRTPMRGPFVFDTSEAGDIHIMGHWSDVSAMLGKSSGATFQSKFGDMFDGDVNVEFDRMYGTPEPSGWFEKISSMPLYVSYNPGAAFTKTDSEGEVVLDPRGEIVKLVGNKVVGIAGAVGPASLGNKALDTISEIKSAIEDHVIPIGELAHEAYSVRKEEKLNKSMCTVSIGVTPTFANYRVGKEKMTAKEVLDIASQLRR